MSNESCELIKIVGIANMIPTCSRAFKQLQLQKILYIPPQKPDIAQVISIHVTIDICGSKFLKTPHGISCDGRILTGNKLVVEGRLQQVIKYMEDGPLKSEQEAHFITPFSSYIMLGEEYNCEVEYHVTGYIEDIYIKQIDNRKLYNHVMILLRTISHVS